MFAESTKLVASRHGELDESRTTGTYERLFVLT
jgi:hypothetical protein